MRPGCAGQTLTMEAVPQPGTCKKGAKFLFIFYGDGEGDGSRSSGDEARSFAARLIASCLSQESRTKSIHTLIQKFSKTLNNLLTQEAALTWFVFQPSAPPPAAKVPRCISHYSTLFLSFSTGGHRGPPTLCCTLRP